MSHKTDILDASVYGRTDVILRCINSEYKDFDNALMHASTNGHDDIVRLLLRAGVNPNIQDSDGNTPLILAVRYGQINATKELLRFCADTTIVNNSGYSVYNYYTGFQSFVPGLRKFLVYERMIDLMYKQYIAVLANNTFLNKGLLRHIWTFL